MKRKLLVLLTVTALVFSALGIVSFADGTGEHVVFYNADTNTPVNYIGEAKNVYARVWLSGGNSENKYVIIAGYDEDGKKTVSAKSDDFLAAEGNTYGQSETLSTDGVSKIKVFVWTKAALIPVLSRTGALEKTYNENNFDDKITVKETAPVTVGTSLTVGDLFDSANVNSETFEITGEGFEFAADTTDWKKGTLTFNNVGEITLTAQDYSFCKPAVAYVNVIEPIDRFTTKFVNKDTYLYRVGNKNAVALSSLFARKGDELDNEITFESSEVNVTVETKYGDVIGTYTENTSDWTKGTIKFENTGVVIVTIQDKYSQPYTLKLEVVSAKNATTYSEMSSSGTVMLNDITMSLNSKFKIENATLYGNGFTFDVSKGAINGEYVSSNYLVCINNAILDNVMIVGAVYTEYGATASSDYNNAVVLSQGNSIIANSYIANCASPVRVNRGSVEIVNTTLKGGNYANIDIRDGNVTLNNVTTINQADLNDKAADGSTVVGLGVVVYYENVPDTTMVTVNGTLKQYNHLSENDISSIKDSKAQSMFVDMFKYENIVYTDATGLKWVNSGILSLIESIGDDKISDVAGYIDENPRYAGKDGYVHVPRPKAPETPPSYETVGQYIIAPKFTVDNSKNDVAKTEGSNDYCYYSDGKINISFDYDESFDWNTSVLKSTKLGNELFYTVKMDGIDYTGKSITFTEGKGENEDYVVEYTITDPYNFGIDEAGNIITFSKTYTEYVYINVSAVKATAKNAEFKFGSGNTASKKATIGSDTYVMPDVSATSSSVGSFTLSGETVYYTIVEAYTSDGKYEHSSLSSWYMCFPVFKNVVTITDYQEQGTGEAVTYNSATTSLPSGLFVNGYSKYFKSSTAPTGAIGFTDGGPESAFIYAASTSAPSTPANVSGVLCYKSPQLSNNPRDEQYVLVRYKYSDNVGATYYYFIGYHMPQTKVSGSGGCVTGDTLVTLADGSYKRIDEVTASDMLMVWDFYKGEYTAVPSAIIFNKYDYADNTVIKLIFEDGTEVKAVNLHQFFNSEKNKFVTIDENSVKDYVGKGFIKRAGNGYKNVKLADYEISKEYVKPYGIISAVHYNILVQDMFSADFMREDYDLFNYFEVGDNMMYGKDKMLSDIEKYGLYSFEDFKEYLTPEQFEAFNVKYMNVAVGKGNYTYEGILSLVEKYLK